MRYIGAVAVAAMMVAAGPLAFAQAAGSQPTPEAVAAPAAGLVLPANTVVELETGSEISSKLHQRGHQFQITLVSPVVVNGVEILPAGVTGMGEVTSAQPAGMGGRPGELMINARYLDYNGVRIPLKTMRVGVRGQDNTMAALAVSYAVGPFALFVTGGNIVLPTQTFARAKVAQEVLIPGPARAAAAPVQAAPSVAPEATQSTSGN